MLMQSLTQPNFSKILIWDDLTVQQQDYIIETLKEVLEEIKGLRKLDGKVALIDERLRVSIDCQNKHIQEMREVAKKTCENTNLIENIAQKAINNEKIEESINLLDRRIGKLEDRIGWWVWLLASSVGVLAYFGSYVIDWLRGK